MGKIRISICEGEGYMPLSMHEGWQVAYLTTCEKHHLDDLENMEVHSQTDEALNMKPFIMYDVPQGVWHNIAMGPDTLLLIIEKDSTHLNDVAYRPFTEKEYNLVNQLMENSMVN